MKVFLLGIDGLTFKILEPLIAKGHLPGFSRLMQEGAWGILRSTVPPITPAAWMSIATGLKPAKHGVLDFLEVHWQDNQIRLSPVTRRKSGAAVWDILSGYGRRVAVANVPCTYPPDPVNGIMVSGFSTPSEASPFTYPVDFQQELFSLVPDYRIDITKAEQYAEYGDAELLSLVHRMTDTRIRLLHLILARNNWDFVFFTMVGSDRLQHPLWRDLTSSTPSTQLVDYYRRLDEVVLQAMDWLGDDGLLLVLSDHGFRGADRLYNINQLQANYGWTRVKPAIRFKNSLISLLGKLRLGNIAETVYSRVIPRSKKARLASERLFASIAVSDSKMWALTYAGSAFASLFFSPSIPAAEQEKILATITAELLAMDVVNPEGVFTGNTLHSALGLEKPGVDWEGPQALMLASPPWAFQGRPRSDRLVQTIETVGTHDMEGCLLVWGKGVKAGPFENPASVYDITPTVLYAFDLPQESDFDGRPLTGLFTFQHQIRIHDRATGAIWEQEAQVSDSVRRKINHLLREAQ